MKIVAVGDSITYGWGGSSRVTPYTTYLNNLIPNDTVVNNGENGNKTSDIVNYFPTRVIAENPGMVIILAGINDIFYYVPVATMESNLETAYNLAITNNITPVCCTLLACSNLNSDYNPSVGSEQLGMALALNNWIRNYALTHNLTVIDFYSATQDPTNPNHLIPSITDDGTHPNERGYELMGNIVYDTLFNTRVMSLTEHGFNSTPFGRDNILTMASGDSVMSISFNGTLLKCWQIGERNLNVSAKQTQLLSGATHTILGSRIIKFPQSFECYTDTEQELSTVENNLLVFGTLVVDNKSYSNCYISSFGNIKEIRVGSGKYTYSITVSQADVHT